MSINSDLQPIVLVCATDNNYAMPLAVTVRSALANLKSNRKIVLYILDGGISPRNKHKISKSLASPKLNIFWITIDDKNFDHLVLNGHLTNATYYRLLIPQLLPAEFNKAIYLDSDMIVNGNLEELWNIPLDDKYLLAVQDDVQLYISMSDGLRNYQDHGISPDEKYFNAGLLVIDLEKWRRENIGLKVMEYIQQNREYVIANDQDGLNAVLAGKWKEIHPRWNQMPKIYNYSSWQESPHSEDIYQELLHKPYIIHFTNPPKPWYAGLKAECQHPKKHLFFEYLDLTSWAGWRDTWWRRLVRKFTKVTSLTTAKL